MGTDNLFHKRKAKVASSLERRKARRASYEKVLIVCEGEKTEPNYFDDLILFYGLNTANVEVDGSCGSSPRSVFQRALDLWQAEKDKGDPFDRVYCVFDKDSHETYEETLRNISEYDPKGIFRAVVSVPCFEYWLLLHYQYTTRPFAGNGKLSVAGEVLKELEKVRPNYAKGDKGIFTELSSQLEFAKSNAERSLVCAEGNHTDNPTTHIHELVSYLQGLKG